MKLFARKLAALALAMLASPPALAQSLGAITAKVKSQDSIVKVWALQRKQTPDGLYAVPVEGTVTGDKLSIPGLLVPGRYDLRFQTASGMVEGWDTGVPHSDYEDEQPLARASVAAILNKMTGDTVSGFDDEVIVLDAQGNIQNAAILATHLRTRPFTTSDGMISNQYIWRVDRWQWESPTENEWIPWDKLPYYALHRERFSPKDYRALAFTFARHLGGIAVTAERPRADLGIILVPKPLPGIHAVNPDGSLTTAVTIKSPGGVEKPTGAGLSSASQPSDRPRDKE